MASVDSLSDSELRLELAKYGFPAGPVTETSRKVLLKKLKLLMGQVGRSSETSKTVRRSTSYFSSGDEESENEDTRAHVNSSMPPPSSNVKNSRRSTSRNREHSMSGKTVHLRNDLFSPPLPSSAPKTGIGSGRPRISITPIINKKSRSSISRATPMSSNKRDGFDTGSDSDIDSQSWNDSNTSRVNARRTSSIRSRSPPSDNSASETSSVNMLLGFRKPALPIPNASSTPGDNYRRNSSFQSTFMKSLSSSSNSPSFRGSPTTSIYDAVKENDELSGSKNGFFQSRRSQLKAFLECGLSCVTSCGNRMMKYVNQSETEAMFPAHEEEGRFGISSQAVSMILLAIVALFFTLIGVMYISVRAPYVINIPSDGKGVALPLCKEGHPIGWVPSDERDLCIDHDDVVHAITIARMLHVELYRLAVEHRCGKGTSAIMSHHEAIKFLVNNNKSLPTQNLEGLLRAFKLLLLHNRRWGIAVVDISTGYMGQNNEDGIRNRRLVDSGSLFLPYPDLPFLCNLAIYFYNWLPALVIMAVGFVVWLIGKEILITRKLNQERTKVEFLNILEKVIGILIRAKKLNDGQIAYLPVNHIRDEIIRPEKRDSMSKIWKDVVNHISQFESRIRVETHDFNGEMTNAMCWLPQVQRSYHSQHSSEKYSPQHQNAQHQLQQNSLNDDRRNAKLWQGQAFDTMMVGSPNSLQCSPTPCLKIRHMFVPDNEYTQDWPVRVSDAVLEKCGEQGVRALHIFVDKDNPEGCVYLKCASQEDAGRAYQALHGWWFDRNLVTVKYLRLERYHERFPDAEFATVPLFPSNNERLSLQWQGQMSAADHY